MTLPKTYNAHAHEDAIYDAWETSGFFNPDTRHGQARTRDTDRRGRPRGSASRQHQSVFTIAMPPPNVTGNLHVGHAMMLAIEDLMIRFERMRGKKTLWVPGLDHAAIATQNVVEKKIWKEEKKTRHDLGRAAFLQRVDAFVQESKSIIRRQIKKMGASCDWSRERYTLDEGLTKAVQTIFVRMYEDGLIYRGNRIVNWCTRCQSTLADDEVNYREEQSKFYYLKYGPVVIGTARPETKFLDKVIIVHPDDARYKKLVGKKFDVPWIEGTVRASVIADAVADPTLGTGAMTITPAHSFEDFALAQKYGLDVHQIIGTDGHMTEAAGEMAGMPVEECRRKVVARLQEKGLIDRIDEKYVHNLSVCYRCDTPIQPLVSKQWFVAVDKKPKSGGKNLKQRAIDAVQKRKITIVPDRFNATYFQWMKNLHDWCISRQLWFGHRVPVWYRHRGQNADKTQTDAEEIYCGVEAPKGDGWEQDPDTLDTWFSAGLWTFSTLGWPMNTKSKNHKIKESQNDLETFHPTSVLETGYDILFFWVARMIMMTTYALDEVPFETVYLHGLVRDKQGRKMSKSLGNGIDPLDVIAKYGADAVRLSLVIGATPGNDVRLFDEKIAGFRNFVNKLWNIGRFVLSNKAISNFQFPISKQIHNSKFIIHNSTLADRWILSRLQHVVASVTDDLERFHLSQAGETLRDFTWGDFADWYLEISKLQMANDKLKETTFNILHSTFCILLKLWHPFTPYVTEVLFQRITPITKLRVVTGQAESPNHRITKDILRAEQSGVEKSSLLLVAEWPKVNKKLIDGEAENQFGILCNAIAAIRNARAMYRVPAATKINAIIVTKHHALFTDHVAMIARFGNLVSCTVTQAAERSKDAIVTSVKGAIIYLLVGDILDVAKEQERLKKDTEAKMAYVAALEKKLTNEEFLKKAPKEIVAAEQAKWEAEREELERLRDLLS